MKIILADDHTLFREALTHYIQRAEPDADIVLARDFHGAMEALDSGQAIDLVMLDLRMPGMNGLQGLQRLRDTYPSVPVVLLSGLAERADIDEALRMGAKGFFPKTLSGKLMLQGIYKILQGETYVPLDHNTNTPLPAYYNDQTQHTGFASAPQSYYQSDRQSQIILTPRESQVLQYLLQGVPNKEIADGLGLQVVTVKLHVRGICRKLGAKNRTQAALRAQQLGLVAAS